MRVETPGFGLFSGALKVPHPPPGAAPFGGGDVGRRTGLEV